MEDRLLRIINSQIERFSGWSFQWLSFPGTLEDRFETDTSRRHCHRLWLGGLLAIGLFDLFLLADYLGSSSHFHAALFLRVAIGTPLALAASFSVLRKPAKAWRESGAVFAVCLLGMMHLYVESGQSQGGYGYAQSGLLIAIVFTNVAVNLRFPYALVASGILALGDLISLRFDIFLRREQKIVDLCVMLTMAAVTLAANYLLNRKERLNYLFCLRSENLVDGLNDSNASLSRIAESDALTGLPNRHALDLAFKQLWSDVLARGTEFSVVMVDVDHFKKMNDANGHLYGDRVLKRIARLLPEALRKPDDFAARFGGEEFVILLPDTHQAAAVLVAERLRKLVELAGFPPIESSRIPFNHMNATVSCGVATAYPKSLEGWHELLSAADKALYVAKAEGRNRVSRAP